MVQVQITTQPSTIPTGTSVTLLSAAIVIVVFVVLVLGLFLRRTSRQRSPPSTTT
jgi:hypothetical protein